MAWLWRVSGVLCLRYLVGSWRAAIVACVFVPVLTELSIGNVTLQIAAIMIFALRDRRGAYLLPWIAALKFGPALLVPYLWFRRPDCRRPLVVGSLVFGVACLAYAAASITCPVLAFSRFASLVGLWRFRRAAEGESDAATTAVPDGAAV